MHIAIIGSGPAGLTAAYRLSQAGHRITIFEARDALGGRTHAEHFGPGHHADTGAGWLASFYTQTLALLEELNCRDMLLPRNVRGASNLLIHGRVQPQPFTPDQADASPLLTDGEKQRWRAYVERLLIEQPAALEPDLARDDRDAEAEFAPLGENVLDYMLRPLLEGPFFTRLSTLSASMARAWVRALIGCTLYQVEGGMDAPWLRLAAALPAEIQTSAIVEAIRPAGVGVEVHVESGSTRPFDGAVLAMPAPAIARVLSTTDQPTWLKTVKYAAHVRMYAARREAADANFGVHIVPSERLFSIEFFSGRRGAWGACPPDWQWALACAFGPASDPLLAMDTEATKRALWDDSLAVTPGLFDLPQASVAHLIRWQWAVPIMAPGHYRMMAAYRRKPPVVLAGDWTHQACVEGAVRSGEAAAAAFGRA
jgi:oxygen-dependent protoporphyrinogen oxidase